MAVMPACVHLACNSRLVWKIGGLLDRQRIHVGAQSDCLARGTFAPVDDADHTGAAEAAHHLVTTESLELLGNRAGGALHVEHQLRVGMQIAPPGGDFAVQVGDTIDDRHDNLRAALAAALV